jgi:hypothetical protein
VKVVIKIMRIARGAPRRSNTTPIILVVMSLPALRFRKSR